jgi:hypothetical protein
LGLAVVCCFLNHEIHDPKVKSLAPFVQPEKVRAPAWEADRNVRAPGVTWRELSLSISPEPD